MTWETQRGNRVVSGMRPERLSMETVTGHAGTRGSQGHEQTRFVHKKGVNRAERSSSQGAAGTAAAELPLMTRYFLASETIRKHERT